MEVEGDALGDEFKGYVFKIMGGQDKQGFPMKQGVQVPGRVKLLMTPGEKCFLGHGRKKGERRRKAVRGCIISTDLSVLNLVIVKRGEADIPGPSLPGCDLGRRGRRRAAQGGREPTRRLPRTQAWNGGRKSKPGAFRLRPCSPFPPVPSPRNSCVRPRFASS